MVGDSGDLMGSVQRRPTSSSFSVRSADGNHVERFPGRGSFEFGLTLFAAALRGEPVETTPGAAVENVEHHRCDLSRCGPFAAASRPELLNPVRAVGTAEAIDPFRWRNQLG